VVVGGDGIVLCVGLYCISDVYCILYGACL